MNVLLISEDYVRTNSNLSENVFGKWILPAIREAQEMGLMPIIGECLYKRICEMVDNGDIDKKVYAAYKDLLDEKIQPYLLYQTLTNIVPLLNGKMGNIGTVATNDEHIVTLSQGELDLTQNYYRERADFYAKRLQEWVKANDLAFPELNCGCGNMKPNLERSNNSVGMWLGGARGKKVRSNDCGCKTDAVRPDCPPCPSYDEGYQSGYTSGHTDGYGEGYDDGYDRGENDGFGEGFESGYTSGHTDGVEAVTTDFRHIDITQNGDYYKVGDYGAYSSITVDVATGSSCDLGELSIHLDTAQDWEAGVTFDEPVGDGWSAVTIQDTSYGQEKFTSGYTSGLTEGYDSGFTSGYSSGYTSGSTNGYDRGYSSGWSSGYSSGYTSGYTDGASQQGGLESITFDVSQDTETIYPNSGYIGMSSVVVNAGDFGDGRYAEGYDDGVASMHVQDVKYDTPTYTEGEPYTVSPDYEYDSMASVELDLQGVHDTGFDEGVQFMQDAAQELTATTNGVWTANTDTGLFSSVTVNVATGSSCNLEDASVTMTAQTQTFEPSSGYDGMSAITVNATALCQDYYNSGYTDAVSGASFSIMGMYKTIDNLSYDCVFKKRVFSGGESTFTTATYNNVYSPSDTYGYYMFDQNNIPSKLGANFNQDRDSRLMFMKVPDTVDWLSEGSFATPYALSVAPNLYRVILPSNLTEIHPDAFGGCYSLKEIVCTAVNGPAITGNMKLENLPAYGYLFIPSGATNYTDLISKLPSRWTVVPYVRGEAQTTAATIDEFVVVADIDVEALNYPLYNTTADTTDLLSIRVNDVPFSGQTYTGHIGQIEYRFNNGIPNYFFKDMDFGNTQQSSASSVDIYLYRSQGYIGNGAFENVSGLNHLHIYAEYADSVLTVKTDAVKNTSIRSFGAYAVATASSSAVSSNLVIQQNAVCNNSSLYQVSIFANVNESSFLANSNSRGSIATSDDNITDRSWYSNISGWTVSLK